MKIWTRLCCALLIGGMLFSCSHAPHEQVTTETMDPFETRPPSARDILFSAPREKTPRTVTGISDGIQYVVTLDQEAYYVGEDIAFRVEATNVSGAPISLLNGLSDSMFAEVIWNGDCLTAGGLPQGWEQPGMTVTMNWMPGETLIRDDGLISSSIVGLSEHPGETMTLNIRWTMTDYCFAVEIPLITDIPEDEALLPYWKNGMIDERLYLRARCMSEEESIVVLGNATQPLEAYMPDVLDADIPQWHREFSMYMNQYSYVRLTRAQLLSILENNYPSELIYAGMLVHAVFDAYPQAKI